MAYISFTPIIYLISSPPDLQLQFANFLKKLFYIIYK